MSTETRILFISDIVGRPGRGAVKDHLPVLKEDYSPDLIIANVENAAGGFGATPDVCDDIFSLGVDCLTSGNHIWDQKTIYGYIDETPALVRPYNFPEGAPGNGIYTVAAADGARVGILNLMGRVFMSSIDCPFKAADEAIDSIKDEVDIIFVDMHAETTSEKGALGHYLDSRVAAVVGTHTHVQTSDERILPKGTAFISDAGMTGPTNSVIGMDKEEVLSRFLSQMPTRFEVARGGVELQGILLVADPSTGLATSIERIKRIKEN